MKRHMLIGAFCLLLFWSWAQAGFRVLRCVRKSGNSTSLVVYLDSQFVDDVCSRLREGADYVLFIDAEGEDWEKSYRLTFSYDVLNQIYIVKDHKQERFKKMESFKEGIRKVVIPLKRKPKRIRARRVDPYLSFPFNLIPGLGTYKTRWVNCSAGE